MVRHADETTRYKVSDPQNQASEKILRAFGIEEFLRLFDYTRQAQHSQELLEFSWRTDCHSTLYVIGSVLGDDLASGLMGRLDMSNLRDARRPSQEVDKVRDLMREVTYERRVVAFYDVLGWRRHIRRAGNKASDVSLLPANPQDGASDTRRKGSGSSGQHVLRQRGD
jgi:hypothetical protein